MCESQGEMHGSSSGCMNQQQWQGSRNSNGNSWRKQSAALCQLKRLQVSALHLKFVVSYLFLRQINPHVSLGWWRSPNFLEDKGNYSAHVCAWSNEWMQGYSWMTSKKTPEMISRTDKALLCYIYTGCSRKSKYFKWEKDTWPKQVKCYFLLKTGVYIDGTYPGNSALHLTVLY